MLLWKKIRDLWRADFLSPKDLVKRACLIAVAFAIVHACGLRDFTSILNGTTGSVGMSWEKAATLGMIYVVFYLAFVILVPSLLIAALISTVWLKYLRHEPRPNPSPTN